MLFLQIEELFEYGGSDRLGFLLLCFLFFGLFLLYLFFFPFLLLGLPLVFLNVLLLLLLKLFLLLLGHYSHFSCWMECHFNGIDCLVRRLSLARQGVLISGSKGW